MSTLKDRLCNLRREEAQSEDAREVGSAHVDFGSQVGDGRAFAAHDQLIEAVCLPEQTRQAAVGLSTRRFGPASDQDLHLHANALHLRRDGQHLGWRYTRSRLDFGPLGMGPYGRETAAVPRGGG